MGLHINLHDTFGSDGGAFESDEPSEEEQGAEARKQGEEGIKNKRQEPEGAAVRQGDGSESSRKAREAEGRPRAMREKEESAASKGDGGPNDAMALSTAADARQQQDNQPGSTCKPTRRPSIISTEHAYKVWCLRDGNKDHRAYCVRGRL